LTPPTDEVTHCPFIRIVPRPQDDPEIETMRDLLPRVTEMIWTSKSAVAIFSALIPQGIDRGRIRCFAVGKATASSLQTHGFGSIDVAEEETAEGLVQLIDSQAFSDPFFLWPHSARSRPVISDYLRRKKFPFFDCVLYDTVTQKPDPLPDLSLFDEVVFTSPSTVEGFLIAYGALPANLRLTPIGPVTAKFLNSKLK